MMYLFAVIVCLFVFLSRKYNIVVDPNSLQNSKIGLRNKPLVHGQRDKCDVIWETQAYREANSVFLDLPFPYVYIHKLFLNCAESKKKCCRQMLISDI